MPLQVRIHLYYLSDQDTEDPDCAKIQAYDDLKEAVEGAGLGIGWADRHDLNITGIKVSSP